MKSVLKNFSQITGGVFLKISLVALCVFTFSFVGGAQSYKNVVDAKHIIKSAVVNMKVAQVESLDQKQIKVQSEVGTLELESVDANTLGTDAIRNAYFQKLLNSIPDRDSATAVSTAISETHSRMVGKYSGDISILNSIRNEVIQLLSI